MSERGAGRRTLLVSAVLILLALITSFGLIIGNQRQLYNEQLSRQMRSTAFLLREAWGAADADALKPLAPTLRGEGLEIIAFDPTGEVHVRASETTSSAGQLLQLPEVRDALEAGYGERVRQLPGHTHDSLVVAVRVHGPAGKSTRGILWLAHPVWTLTSTGRALQQASIAISLIALAGAIGLALLLAHLRTRLIERLTDTARTLSEGDLTAKVEVPSGGELGNLSLALNQMRNRMSQQVEMIDRQRLTLESLVDQLHEGVIVARPDGRIALINPAAVRLLNLPATDDPTSIIGQPLEVCVPQHDLQQMLRGEPVDHAVAVGDRNTEQETSLRCETPDGSLHILARASDVLLPQEAQGDNEQATGRMLVLTDITELGRILQIKTDFVANASHELRTPLAAIRASVETLLQLDPETEADAVHRFLGTINRHCRRLEAMVSDLLDLSRLESAPARFKPLRLQVADELDELHARFAERLQAREITWDASHGDGPSPTILVPPHLLRLVLDNLVENATKFTDAGGRISVTFDRTESGARFVVEDTGCGIPEPDQERVFERFYQVERARSGDERGTGLGLSIVRHAVSAMKGEVSLTSEVGKGTRVEIRVPQSNVPGQGLR